MIIQKSNHKPPQFDTNLEKIIIRTFEKRSKNRSRERAVLYVKARYGTIRNRIDTVISSDDCNIIKKIQLELLSCDNIREN